MDLTDPESSDEFIKCKYCGKVFLTDDLLQIHIGRYHKDILLPSSSPSPSTVVKKNSDNGKKSNAGYLVEEKKFNLENKMIQITPSPVFLQDLQTTTHSATQKRSVRIETKERDVIDGLDLTYSHNEVLQEISSMLFGRENNGLNTSDLVVPIKANMEDISPQEKKVVEGDEHLQSDLLTSHRNISMDVSSNDELPMSPEEKHYLDAIKKAKELLNPYAIRRKNTHIERNKLPNKQTTVEVENNSHLSNKKIQQNIKNKHDEMKRKIISGKKKILENNNIKEDYSYDEEEPIISKSDGTKEMNYSEESISTSQSENYSSQKHNSYLTINPLSRKSLYRVNVHKSNTTKSCEIVGKPSDYHQSQNTTIKKYKSEHGKETELKQSANKQDFHRREPIIPTLMKTPFVKPLNVKQQNWIEKGNFQEIIPPIKNSLDKDRKISYKDRGKDDKDVDKNEKNEEHSKQLDQFSVALGNPSEIVPIKTSKSLNVRQIRTPNEGIFFSSITRTSCILHIKVHVKNIPSPPSLYIDKGVIKDLSSGNRYERETSSRTMSFVLYRNRVQIYSCVLKYAPYVCITLEDKELMTQTEYVYRCSVNGTNSIVGRMCSM